MKTLLLDGPSKSGKSTIGQDLSNELGGELDISLKIAGDFFRSVASAVLHEAGTPNEIWNGDDTLLEKTLDEVLANQRLYDSSIDWGNLHRPPVEKLVSVVSGFPQAQAAGDLWYEAVVRQAYDEQRDVLLIDGRNPRERTARIMAALGLQVNLHLFVDCEVHEMARRLLTASGIPLTPEAVDAKALDIQARRDRDLQRTSNPMTYPSQHILFELNGGLSPDDAIAASYQAHQGEYVPLPIYFDTTPMSMGDMVAAARGLARASLSYPLTTHS